MEKSLYLITAAGGNGTAIKIIPAELSRDEYARDGAEIGTRMESLGAEQSGFLVQSIKHFEMAGGEFCGNASRAAAVLFSRLLGTQSVSFTVSGFSGTVNAEVETTGTNTYRVSVSFPGLPVDAREVTVLDTAQAYLVDLGGIVHVLIEGVFPAEVSEYKRQHRLIVEQLGLAERGAVGVIWYTRRDEIVRINPVVWVKTVDTFFYEQSCGSGSIAAAKITGANIVRQPTEQDISVSIENNVVTLSSEMEVVHEQG